MFCALNGATDTPRLRSHAQIAVAIQLLPALDEVPPMKSGRAVIRAPYQAREKRLPALPVASRSEALTPASCSSLRPNSHSRSDKRFTYASRGGWTTAPASCNRTSARSARRQTVRATSNAGILNLDLRLRTFGRRRERRPDLEQLLLDTFRECSNLCVLADRSCKA